MAKDVLATADAVLLPRWASGDVVIEPELLGIATAGLEVPLLEGPPGPTSSCMEWPRRLSSMCSALKSAFDMLWTSQSVVCWPLTVSTRSKSIYQISMTKP